MLKLDTNQLLDFFKSILLIRRFEERVAQSYGMGLIGGFCHLSIGQEAVVVGAHAAMKLGVDSIVTSYRDHAHALLFGLTPREVLCELFGKENGCSKGKGGSMHMFSRKDRFFGGHGIVGAQVSVGTGLAFAHKYNEDGGVALVFYGDGAANQGQVFESFNIASLWNLPVLYVVENNEYGMGTSVKRSSAGENFYSRGKAFGIEGREVDGMNILEIYQVFSEAIANIRTTQRPFIIEVKTYRFRGHSMSDPAKYRTKEEVEEYKLRDPLEIIKSNLIENHAIEETIFDELEANIQVLLKDALEFAKNDKELSLNALYEDVYSR